MGAISGSVTQRKTDGKLAPDISGGFLDLVARSAAIEVRSICTPIGMLLTIMARTSGIDVP